MKIFLWPRKSFLRSLQYVIKRVLRLTATPHAIAAGVAAGVFVSFTPFVGFHLVSAAALAFILRGNLVASALGTAIGNPLTFPFIWGATFELGRFILYGAAPDNIRPLELGSVLFHLKFGELWEPLLLPMTVGSIPLGLVFAIAFYIVTRMATRAFQERRRLRLRRRAAAAFAGSEAMSRQ